jgi:XTP/dITP diphosphohydrolase
MHALLKEEALELLTPDRLGLSLSVEESGETYAENAALKAQAFAQASGLVSLADDSGLEVAALDGRPGLHSARFAPQPGATDSDRRAVLLKLLKDHPQPWTARFVCVVAIAKPDGTLKFAEGECAGMIIPEERGCNGFGYDPLFFIPEIGKTMAELDMDEKNRLSHRARAVKAAIPILHNLW